MGHFVTVVRDIDDATREYYEQIRLPCFGKNIIKTERVQRRLRRMSPGIACLGDRERFGLLGRYSLESRGLRRDL